MKRERIHRLSFHGHEIAIVERVSLESKVTATGCWCVATHEPVAIIFEVDGRNVVVGVDGSRVQRGQPQEGVDDAEPDMLGDMVQMMARA